MRKSNEAVWQRCEAALKKFGIDTRCGGGALLMDCLMVVVKEEIPGEEIRVAGLARELGHDDHYSNFCNSMRQEICAAYDRRDEALWLENGFGIKPTVLRFLGKLGWKIIGEMEE